MQPTRSKAPYRRPSGPPVNPDPARHAAVCIISHVMDQRWTVEEAMRREQSFVRLDGRDRGFAAHLILATLRSLGIVDAVLATKLSKPLPDSAHYARALLRVGAAQLIEGLAPPHAAVGRSVDLAKYEATGRGFSGLINAVLRRIATEPLERPHDRVRVQSLWWSRWRGAYGAEAADAIAASLAHQPALDLSFRGDATDLLEALGGTLLPTGSIRLNETPSDVTALPFWQEGRIWVQDAAASLPAKLLAAKAGDKVLDMCAAPGGKTLQLAATGADVTAIDIDASRISKVADNLARTHLIARLRTGDARTLAGSSAYDAILLDAPCSATGTLRRNPETLWIKTPSDVIKFAPIQAELIAAAAKALKPGGRLVYAVCSLEPEEASMAVEAAAQAGLVPSPITEAELPTLETALTPEGHVRILPGMWADSGGLDGFFIARFTKPNAKQA
jgi:16S rRNA (cytosine967-C5)-methyltransferase